MGHYGKWLQESLLGGFCLLPQQDLAQLNVPMLMLHIKSKSHNLQTRPQFNPIPKKPCFFNIFGYDRDQGILTKSSNSLERGIQFQQVAKQKLFPTFMANKLNMSNHNSSVKMLS